MGRTCRTSHASGAGTASIVPVVLAIGVAAFAQPAAPDDPFTFFRPAVEITRDERRRLARGDAIARVLPAESGEVAIFAAVQTSASGSRLVNWVRRMADFKKSPYVSAVARFSEPPRQQELDGLALDNEDLGAIRSCRPGSCDLKLTASEIASLQEAARSSPGGAQPQALQAAFRGVILKRLSSYLSDGHAGLAPYADRHQSTSLQQSFSQVMERSGFIAARLPAFARYLEHYPDAPADGIESFTYWSKEQLGGRPIVSATHVAIVTPSARDLPEVVVAGKQIFATHYVNASLNITALTRAGPGGSRYLVYLNRSRLDLLERWYSGLARRIIERRIRNEATGVLQGLRRRLESGEPPA